MLVKLNEEAPQLVLATEQQTLFRYESQRASEPNSREFVSNQIEEAKGVERIRIYNLNECPVPQLPLHRNSIISDRDLLPSNHANESPIGQSRFGDSTVSRLIEDRPSPIDIDAI